MRVTADDGVDPLRQSAGQIDDLAVAGWRRFCRTERAGMRDDHHHLGAARPQCLRAAVDDRDRVDEAKVADVGRAGGRGGGNGGDTDDPDAETAGGDDRVVRNPWNVLSPCVGDVGAEYGIVRFSHAGAQRVLSPVELVVA
jgi:hypothetical protein